MPDEKQPPANGRPRNVHPFPKGRRGRQDDDPRESTPRDKNDDAAREGDETVDDGQQIADDDAEIISLIRGIESGATSAESKAVFEILRKAGIPESDPAWAIAAAMVLNERVRSDIAGHLAGIPGRVTESVERGINRIGSDAIGSRIVGPVRTAIVKAINDEVSKQMPLLAAAVEKIETRTAARIKMHNRLAALKWTVLGLLGGVAATGLAVWTVRGLPGAGDTMLQHIVWSLDHMTVGDLFLPGIAILILGILAIISTD